MKTNQKIVYGLLMTIVIFLTANLVSSLVGLNGGFVPSSFVAHTLMLVLAALAIYLLRENIGFKVAVPKFSSIWKPILFGILTAFVVNVTMSLITKLVGSTVEQHPLTQTMNPMQVFLFIFILASVAEELLFRGFLQNILQDLKDKKLKLFGINLSLSVVISAVTFGLSHLILLSAGVNVMFLLRTIIFTFVLGLVAGYYQEKYDNHAYAVIVHMSGNLLGLFAVLLATLR